MATAPPVVVRPTILVRPEIHVPSPMVVIEQSTPDWTATATAIGTDALALGVIVTLAAFIWQQRTTQIVETGKLIDEWNKGWADRSWLDDDDKTLEENREYAKSLYDHIWRNVERRKYDKLCTRINDFIEDHARLADRIGTYLRKHVASESVIGEHIAYDIIVTYYIIQDILKERAFESDRNYEGFRDLALRMQDYAKIHPDDADLRDDIVFAVLDPIVYEGGDMSEGYSVSPWRRARLAIAELRRRFSAWREKSR